VLSKRLDTAVLGDGVGQRTAAFGAVASVPIVELRAVAADEQQERVSPATPPLLLNERSGPEVASPRGH
jgi:hypothetical protein